MKAILSVLILAFLLGTCSCENDDGMNVILIEDGTFEGTFTVTYDDGQTFSNPVTIGFDGEQYSSSSGDNRFPAGGNGEYKVQGDVVEFVDENIWTADFDWGLVLSGTYELSQSNSTIEFLKKSNSGNGFYRYKLKKK